MANSTTVYKLPDGRNAVDVSESKVLTAADQGIVQNVIADGITVTLASVVAGQTFTVRNGGKPVTSGPVGSGYNFSVAVTVVPPSGKEFIGNGFTAANDKNAVNTKATAKVGDQMTFVSDGSAGYNISAVKGIWARSA